MMANNGADVRTRTHHQLNSRLHQPTRCQLTGPSPANEGKPLLTKTLRDSFGSGMDLALGSGGPQPPRRPKHEKPHRLHHPRHLSQRRIKLRRRWTNFRFPARRRRTVGHPLRLELTIPDRC